MTHHMSWVLITKLLQGINLLWFKLYGTLVAKVYQASSLLDITSIQSSLSNSYPISSGLHFFLNIDRPCCGGSHSHVKSEAKTRKIVLLNMIHKRIQFEIECS